MPKTKKKPKRAILWQEEEEALQQALQDIEKVGAPAQEPVDTAADEVAVDTPAVQTKSMDSVSNAQRAMEAVHLDMSPQKTSKKKKAPPPAPSRTPQSRSVDSVQTKPAEELEPVVSQASPEEPAPEVVRAAPSKPESDNGVVSIYRLPSHARFMSNKRLFYYTTFLMVLGLIFLAVSYYAPQGLIPFVQAPDDPLTVNLWRLRRFPFSNMSIPMEGAIVTEPQVGISGMTLPGTDIMVNGEPVLVSPNGSFEIIYPLKPGPNNIELTAALGEKEERVMRQVYYVVTADDPEEEDTEDDTEDEEDTDATDDVEDSDTEDDDNTLNFDTPTNTPIEVKLTIGDNSTWLEVSVDGVDYPRDEVDPEDEVIYEVTETISLSTGDGGSLLLTINGNEIGPLGRPNTSEERELSYEDLQEFLLYQ